jgi:hypothetical protein
VTGPADGAIVTQVTAAVLAHFGPNVLDRQTYLVPRIVRQALDEAQPLIAAAERERLFAELGSDHYVIYTEDRWTIEHSVQCRLGGRMHECAHHEAIAAVSEEYDPAMAGRWLIVNIDSEGLPVLERADLAGGDKP